MKQPELIAMRAAQEVGQGQMVNLGVGIPTLVSDYLDAELDFILNSENGIIGMGQKVWAGQEDRDLIDAGGGYVSVVPGASFIDSSISFGLIRSGRLDLAILGALQVSQEGDLANWMIPGKFVPGIGGGMELAWKARRVIATMFHTDKLGNSKIVRECNIPVTACGVVDLVVSDLAVMSIDSAGLVLKEVMPGSSVELIIQKTDAELIIPDEVPLWQPMGSGNCEV